MYLQVDLGFLRYVTGIGTQGAISKETKKQYFVRSYKVDLSTNGEDWITMKQGSKPKVMMSLKSLSNRNRLQRSTDANWVLLPFTV